MTKLISVQFQNFQSYGSVPVKIDLENPGTTIISGSNGAGKAQPLTARIKTPTGWTTMGDTRIDDVISTPDGKSGKITNIFPQGNIDTYRITFQDGRSTECCGDHLWKVYSHQWRKDYKSNDYRIVTTTQITELLEKQKQKNKALYNISIPHIIPPNDPDINLLIPPYLIGALLGDGNMTSRSVGFTSKDDQIVKQVGLLLETTSSQELTLYGSNDNNISFQIRNAPNIKHKRQTKISDLLQQYNLLGLRSHEKFIPNEYFNSSVSQKLELLQGLLDTDGTVSKGGSVSFCSSSKQLAEDVTYLVRSIGGSAKTYIRSPHYKDTNGNIITGKLAYDVTIQYHDRQSLFTLERKLSRLPNQGQYANAKLRIKSIEHIGKQNSQCITIDHPDKLYITDNFITTHNSTIINAISYGLYDNPVSDISKDGLINNINGKNMEVVVEFEKNKHHYKVRRYRKMKGNGVELWEDDNDITPDSISNTNVMIERILNMPHDLFVRVIIFSAINVQFLNLPMRKQADMLEELLDLKLLSAKGLALKEQIKDTKRSLEMEDEHIVQANKECHHFIKQYERAYNRASAWEKTHQENIKECTSNLSELLVFDIDKEMELLDKSDKIIAVTEDVKHSLELYKRDLSDEQKIIDDLEHAEKSSKRWERDNAQNIIDIQKTLDEWLAMDVDDQTKLHDTVDSLTEAEQDILQEQHNITSQLADLNKVLTSNTGELEHLSDNKCPYCKQQFEETKEKIAECTTNIAAANKETATLTGKLTECVDDVKALNTQIEKIDDKILFSRAKLKQAEHQIIVITGQLGHTKSAVNGWLPDIEELTKKVNPKLVTKLEGNIARLTKDIEEQNKELDAIAEIRKLSPTQITEHNQAIAVNAAKLKDLKDQTNTLNQPVEDLESELFDVEAEKTFITVFEDCGLPIDNPTKLFEDIQPKIMDSVAGNEYVFIKGTKRSDELHKLSDHQQFLLKLLTHKNSFIRKTMLNQTIPFLNKQLDGYLKTMGLPHAVAFTPKMEVTIHKLGKELQYGNLSNGQQCRVNVALSFAFRDVLQFLHDKINVLVLDEVLDIGLDSEGIHSAAGMIKQKAINDDIAIYVISHRDEIDNTFNEKIHVELIDGFSKIVS